MFRKCVINNCNTIKAGDGVSLHSLPIDPHLQQEWFRAILRETGQKVFTEDDVICSKHFSIDSFSIVEGNFVLNPSAIPFNKLAEGIGPTVINSSSEVKRMRIEIETIYRCCVFSCSNNSKDNPGLRFQKFPTDPFLRTKWLQWCNVDDGNFDNKFVCSNHFGELDFAADAYIAENVLESDDSPCRDREDGKTQDFMIMEVLPKVEADFSSEASSSSTGLENSFRVDELLCVIQTCPASQNASIMSSTGSYLIPLDIPTRKIWLDSIESHTRQTNIPQIAFICYQHFANDCFQMNFQTGKKILSTTSVPTIFNTAKSKVKRARLENDDFPNIDLTNCQNEDFVKFHQWSMKRNEEYLRMRKMMALQAGRISRLAKSIDEFKSKRFVSDEANAALQNLFDKVVDAQYSMV